MIQIENADVWGFEHAIRGMRNPMNSWDKSDSHGFDPQMDCFDHGYQIGKNDLDLMRRLYKAGSEHRKYLRQIFVSMDVTAPLYWWKEMDQYKIGTVTDSCSTMHTIHSKKFEPSDFSCEHLCQIAMNQLNRTIEWMNVYREHYLQNKNKEYWWQMIQLLPSSYNQKRTITMNYENVVNIIKQRSGHKLTEWGDFIAELKKLPYITEIMGD